MFGARYSILFFKHRTSSWKKIYNKFCSNYFLPFILLYNGWLHLVNKKLRNDTSVSASPWNRSINLVSSLRSVRSAQSESSAAVPKRVSRPPNELCAVPWTGNVTNSAGEMNGACGIGVWSGSTDVNNRGGLKSFNCKKGTPRLGRVPKTPAATSLGIIWQTT